MGTKKKPKEQKKKQIVIPQGQIGMAVEHTFIRAFVKKGLTEAQARDRFAEALERLEVIHTCLIGTHPGVPAYEQVKEVRFEV